MTVALQRARFVAWGFFGGALLVAVAAELAVASSGVSGPLAGGPLAWVLAGVGLLAAVFVESRARRAPDDRPEPPDARLLLRLHTQGLVAAYAPSLAHDGNNALLEMRFGLAELRRLHDRDGVTRGLTDGLDHSVTVLEELIRRLRGLEDGGARTHEPHPFDLAALVRHTLAGLSTHLRSRACEVEERLPDSLAAHGVSRDLEQMILSLVLHAVDRCGDGGNVQVELSSEPGVAHLRIHDDGPAPDEDELRAPLNALEASNADPEGLRLWASRWHARAHDGELRLLAGRSGGVMRHVRLPLRLTAPEVEVLDTSGRQDGARRDSDDIAPVGG